MSFATEIRADRRENGKVEYDTWDRTDPAFIEEVIRRMDQRQHTETTISGPDWWFIIIGGGSGSYVVGIENQMSGVLYQLVDPAKSEHEMVEVVTGGQLGQFPSRLVVGLDEAVEAAKHFAETGKPEPSLNWVEEQTA
jgi:hypothetical protein